MNRIIRVILVIAIFLLLLFLFFRTRSPFGNRNSGFSVEPDKEITRIEFIQDHHRLTLEKSNDTWLLNGKNETRKSGIFFILRLLKEIKIKSPVSAQLYDTEVTKKNISPVKVKVYYKRKLLKSFLVYKTTSNTYGNIMKLREGSKPFIVYVPGFEGDIGSGFNMNELFWQPYSLFNLLPSEISAIDFENEADTINSFSIIRKGNRYLLSHGGTTLTGWDTTILTRYISYFTWIPFETWALDLNKNDQKLIEEKPPLYKITVTLTSGARIMLTLWQKMNTQDQSGSPDTDRLFGKTNENDNLFIIRYFDIDPILQKKSYFFNP